MHLQLRLLRLINFLQPTFPSFGVYLLIITLNRHSPQLQLTRQIKRIHNLLLMGKRSNPRILCLERLCQNWSQAHPQLVRPLHSPGRSLSKLLDKTTIPTQNWIGKHRLQVYRLKHLEILGSGPTEILLRISHELIQGNLVSFRHEQRAEFLSCVSSQLTGRVACYV
ncbi:hypothetical protein K470DRAFT_82756 [Piedraia hortae CBS 480.64]|uniref:Uncharacterized protein n=1 Tax=Piedraia hortae CBS 480.64 TaxID=1314780 RepID=A0A6A7C9P4_9PEZI|nr:hypothetical protein K470DRAFT_82756 [Piedraia hortae CBS 480.64]